MSDLNVDLLGQIKEAWDNSYAVNDPISAWEFLKSAEYDATQVAIQRGQIDQEDKLLEPQLNSIIAEATNVPIKEVNDWRQAVKATYKMLFEDGQVPIPHSPHP